MSLNFDRLRNISRDFKLNESINTFLSLIKTFTILLKMSSEEDELNQDSEKQLAVRNNNQDNESVLVFELPEDVNTLGNCDIHLQ